MTGSTAHRFTADELATFTGGQLLSAGPAGPITTDSRSLSAGAWFVALSGDRFDGHSFLDAAAAAGCAGAVGQRMPPGWTRGFVQVPDSLRALQDLARAARARFAGPVVGVTGSAGKTTTRAMIALVLEGLGPVHQTVGNLNNHIGVPLTLLAAPDQAAAWVVEMGMNHLGEIDLLQDIAGPTVRLITNVGAAHLEGLGSLENIARAKGELFDGARPGDICCVNADDPRVRARPIPPGALVLTWGALPGVDVRLTEAQVDTATLRTRVRIETPNGALRAVLPSPGLHLAANAAAAVACGVALRLPLDGMADRLEAYAPVGMRQRVEHLDNGLLVINDAYNANPPSMGASLRTLAGLPGRRFAVLGDMLELGSYAAQAHAEVLAMAMDLQLDGVVVFGPHFAAAAADRPADARPLVAADAEAAAALLRPGLQPRDVILLKGSRGSAAERALPPLRLALER
jgi:UDP-N-acetylmuramoyl-tripeptide--D-alanyl-D-alanine ligase